MTDEGLLTYEDLAKLTRTPSKPKGLSIRTLRRMVARRKIRAIEMSHSCVRFRRAWFEADMQKLTTKTL